MNKVTVYIPTAKLDLYHVGEVVRTLTLIAGGRTETPSHGHWQAPAGELVSEPITQVSFLRDDGGMYADESTLAKNVAFAGNLDRLVRELHDSGEQSVLIERTQVETEFV